MHNSVHHKEVNNSVEGRSSIIHHRHWLIFLIPLIFTSRLDGSQPDFVRDSFAMLLWVSSWLADFTPKSQCLHYERMFTIYQFYMRCFWGLLHFIMPPSSHGRSMVRPISSPVVAKGGLKVFMILILSCPFLLRSSSISRLFNIFYEDDYHYRSSPSHFAVLKPIPGTHKW